ncbi:hypothetical protein RRG08_009098 [Elysia crispata]|uniref:Uncharacterized protein n=1 Tax=Elysia crispata TaxID=231223 RepID=A0AAE0YYG5_9GAST|nr:hypothetical protein RRG08_009098 [Elysia crispata]
MSCGVNYYGMIKIVKRYSTDIITDQAYTSQLGCESVAVAVRSSSIYGMKDEEGDSRPIRQTFFVLPAHNLVALCLHRDSAQFQPKQSDSAVDKAPNRASR